jgi:hypothetical protein
VPGDYYGVDVDDVRARLRAALDDPDALDGWRVSLDDAEPTAYSADYEYADGLD